MEEKEKTELEELKKYLGLDSLDDARKAKWILDELKIYGSWGDKVSVYLTSILSGHDGTRTFIPENRINAFKTLFENYAWE